MSKIRVKIEHRRSKQVEPRQWETMEIGMEQEDDINEEEVSPEAARKALREQIDGEVLEALDDYFHQFEKDEEVSVTINKKEEKVNTSKAKVAKASSKDEEPPDMEELLDETKKPKVILSREDAPVKEPEESSEDSPATQQELDDLMAGLDEEE